MLQEEHQRPLCLRTGLLERARVRGTAGAVRRSRRVRRAQPAFAELQQSRARAVRQRQRRSAASAGAAEDTARVGIEARPADRNTRAAPRARQELRRETRRFQREEFQGTETRARGGAPFQPGEEFLEQREQRVGGLARPRQLVDQIRRVSGVRDPVQVLPQPRMPVLALFGISNGGLDLAVNLIVLFLVVIWLALIAWTYLDARRRIEDRSTQGSPGTASWRRPRSRPPRSFGPGD